MAQNILESEPYSRHAYIYKISTEQAKTFFEEDKPEYNFSYFQTLVDSFPVKSEYQKNLQQGYYLKVEIVNNKVKTALTTVQNFNVFIYNNDKDLNLKVLDLEGNPINTAKVKLKRKNISYNDKTNTYSLNKAYKSGLLTVAHEGHTFFYDLKKSDKRSVFMRKYTSVMYGFPLKYVWTPVMFVVDIPIDAVRKISGKYTYGSITKIKRFAVNLYEGTLCIFDKDYCDDPKIFGYVITDKPKYRPNDTVKLKAYLLNKKYKAIDKPLEIVLYQRYTKKKKLGTLSPYAEGGYTYEFKLHDSLNLKLDTQYSLKLMDENLFNYQSVNFYYEDYTLKGNTVIITSKTETQYKGDSLAIYIDARDENELKLMDARVEILVKPERNFKAFEDRIFIPDTLWKTEQKLDPKSNTKINIPPDIFPVANLDYKVEAVIKTADNEVTKTDKQFSYVYQTTEIESKLLGDTLRLYFTENGKEIPKKAKLYIKDSFDNVDSIPNIDLPYKHKINPYKSTYEVVADSLFKEIRLDKYSDDISINTLRTHDSLFVEVSNSRQLELLYHTYKLNREIDEGKSKSKLVLKYAADSKKNYYFSLSYLWAGKVVKKNYEIKIQESQLTLNVEQPGLIYPGKTDTVNIKVTDYKNKPVEDVDISAYGLTKKFNYSAPRLPDLQKNGKRKRVINNFSIRSDAFNQQTYRLNINEWEEKARLDSIIYYDFMYPKGVFKTEVGANDSITQFAPFVMKNGLQEEVKVIYVDDNPIYTDWNNHEQTYSFVIDSGYHNIGLRTKERLHQIDSLYFKDKTKTIFSIDTESQSPKVKTSYLGSNLTDLEKRQLYPRIMMYDEHSNDFLAYIKNKDRYFLIDKTNNYFRNNYKKNLITGPIYGSFEFMTYDSLQYNQPHESYYNYTFYPKYLRLRSVKDYSYPKYFSQSNQTRKLADIVLTKALIQKIWEQKMLLQRRNTRMQRHPYKTSKGFTTLKLIDEQPNPDKVILNTIIIDQDRDDFRVYNGYATKIYNLKPQKHSVIFLFNDMTYQVLDDINTKPFGINVLTFSQPKQYIKDFLSSTFNEILNQTPLNVNSFNAYKVHINKLREAYNRSEPYFGPGNFVSGVVTDYDGLPVPGVNVIIKGTTTGTQTDFDGRYIIKVPSNDNMLIFSYVGFKTVETPSSLAGDLVLETNLQELNEVVVTSYRGILKESEVVSDFVLQAEKVKQVPMASIDQLLQGNVAGVNISYASGQPGQSGTVTIRGRTSINGDTEPLYIVDGMPVNAGEFRKLMSDNIQSMRILKDAAATAIYGNRGAAGVILINTFSGTSPLQGSPEMAFDGDFYAENSAASSIRNNFSDVAYWQPKLRTDENGEASFIVTYPDDITSWQTIVLAMNENRQSGSYQSFVKAYKPVSARLYTPKFLIEGDETKAIGKSLNYTQDTLDITTSLEVNGQQMFSQDKASTNAKIDTLNITAKTDSLKLTYKLQQKNSEYFDGEKRIIPVFRKGVEVNEGAFRILMPGDTLDYNAKFNKGKVEVYVEADALNLIETDLDYVINYRYDCNEQLASKLNMLLSKQEIYKYLDKDFNNDREIKKIIKTLQKNRNSKQLWGWWKSSKSTSYWISQHVVKALLKAQKTGYDTDINQESLSIFLKNEFYKDISIHKKIEILSTLSLLDNKPVLSLSEEIKSIFYDDKADLNQKLSLSLIAENFNLKADIDFLDNHQSEDMLGNMYFDDDNSKSSWISNNRIRNTLLAYQLIRKVKPNDERLPPILLYLLNAKTEGRYLNTYQATNIMETVLPDLLKDTTEKPEAKITINNLAQESFPFKTTYADEDVSINNTGNIPVYVTAYQHYFKTEPEQRRNDFEIESYFIGKPDNTIKNGEEVTLKITLKVKKEAEYTMLNIPIPGGFDYTLKPVNYGLEDHREYFKHETGIFCSQLKEGEYTFEIPLVAKYSGIYNLNPAKVELMYFPTFHAHEGLKMITVK